MKQRNQVLYHILLSFVKSLPFAGLFRTTESRIDWLWEYLFEDVEYYKDSKNAMKNHSTRFYTRYKTFLETYEIQDWKTLLDGYRPRKPIYRQIKELLLRAETIDFEVPFRLSSKDGYDCMFEHFESFLVVDRTDSAFVNGYIQMLNDCSNDYDIKSAYQHTVAEQGNIELFDEGIPHRLNRLEEFVSDLNELLTELLNMEKIAVLQAKDHYLPKFAIIGYAQEENDYRNEHYFSYHEVAGTKLMAGMPLTKGTARNIFTCLEGDLIKFRFKGMLPKNLIHFDFKGSFQLIWYAHPKQRMLYFDTKTGIPSGKYPLPKLVFKLEGSSLKVFALKRKDTLTDHAPLYHAPLLNIGRQGNVCMENASMDYDGFEFYEDIKGFVEQQFFRSVFTETHHNQLVNGNLVNVMRNNLEKLSFDDGLLISNKMTLNQLYES